MTKPTPPMKAKRLSLAVLLSALALAGLALAGRTPPPPSLPPPPPEAKVDVDLTKLNRTMVYSQIFDMMRSPGAYRGKLVRMKGTYATTVPQGTTNRYHACLITDAAACCAQGVEFVPTNAVAYPADFPNEGAPILVQGVFDTYEEDGNRYSHIRDAFLSFSRPAAPAAKTAPPAAPSAPDVAAPAPPAAAPAPPAAKTTPPAAKTTPPVAPAADRSE